MMRNVARAIDRFAVELKLHSEQAATYDDEGRAMSPAPSVSSIRGTMQPASGRQLMDMPEGVREEAQWVVWTRSSLKNQDIIERDGTRYRVVWLAPRAEGGFNRAALGMFK